MQGKGFDSNTDEEARMHVGLLPRVFNHLFSQTSLSCINDGGSEQY